MTGKCKKGLGYGGKSKKCIGRKFKLKKPADVKELCSGVQVYLKLIKLDLYFINRKLSI